jgi:beta-glucosidase
VAPTAPGAPAASDVTASSVKLSWAASTDDVGVTGYDVVRIQDGAETAAATAASPSATVGGLTANTAYTFAVYARDAAGNRSTRSASVAVRTAPASTGSTCTITPATQSQWSGGYITQATVANPGTAAINGWTVTFTLPAGQSVTGSWGAAFSVSGRTVTARNLSYNGALGPNAGTSFGFQVSRPSGDTSVASAYTCAAD